MLQRTKDIGSELVYSNLTKDEEEFKRLEDLDVIEKVVYSSWGTPVVPIVKKDETIRLRADYKVTINKGVQDDRYLTQTIEDISYKINGGKYFCTLDIYQAYQAISTHLGCKKEYAKPLTVTDNKPLTAIFNKFY